MPFSSNNISPMVLSIRRQKNDMAIAILAASSIIRDDLRRGAAGIACAKPVRVSFLASDSLVLDLCPLPGLVAKIGEVLAAFAPC